MPEITADGDGLGPEQGELRALRAEYLAALEENTAARRRHDEILAQAQPPTQDAVNSDERHGILQQHFQLLREQKRHGLLIGLKDDLDDLTRISSEASRTITPAASEDLQQEFPKPEYDLAALDESINQQVNALELAVIQAHYEAKQEKSLLDRAKAAMPDCYSVTDERSIFALLKVRDELTTWLEQNLEKCQENTESLYNDDIGVEEKDGTDWDAKIEAQYEQYLQARKRLISAVTILKTPLPETTVETKSDNKQPKEQPPLPQDTSEAIDLLNAIETRLLPATHQRNMIQAQLTFLDEQLEKETQLTTNMLNRISDESQLLQAYPLLGHSGRFQHAAFVFGNKKKEMVGAKDDDPLLDRLEPWLFAANAADVVSTESVEKQLRLGTEASESVSRNLAELQLLGEIGS